MDSLDALAMPTQKPAKKTARHPCSICGNESVSQYHLRPESVQAGMMKEILGFPPDLRKVIKEGRTYFNRCFNHDVDSYHSRYVKRIVKYYFDLGPVTNGLWKSDIDIR